MAIINFENMKATEPDRNFDNANVDENYNIGLQNGQGFYGAGKFFGLVQKAVNWISTITGNKNFTGTLSVNSKEVATTESVNNALANYETLLSKSTYLSGVDFNDYKTNGYYTKNGSCTNQPTTRAGLLIVSNGKAYKTQEYICPTLKNGEYIGIEHYIRWCSDTNVWTPWTKTVTETDLSNALANYRKVTTYTCNLGDFSKVEDFVNSLPIDNREYAKRWGKLIDDKITAGISNYFGKFINESNGFFYGTLCMGANATYFSLKTFSYNTNQEIQFTVTNTKWEIIFFN